MKPPPPGWGESFLKGPVPIGWLWAAGRLPGKALLVGLDVWFRAGVQGRGTVRLSRARSWLRGLDRWTVHRALRALERAELVEVERVKGRAPMVTLRWKHKRLDGGTT